MSDGYVETALIEANRSRSQEVLGGNNDNPSTWTNTLGDIYHLKAGDKVSLYAGYVSEKGAGSQKTIEIKGSSLGKTKSFTYTKEVLTLEEITKRRAFSEVTQVTEDIELRDNVANLVLGFYKNMNGTGYITLPRRYAAIGGDGPAGFNSTDVGDPPVNTPNPLTEIPWQNTDSELLGAVDFLNASYYLRTDRKPSYYGFKLGTVINDNAKYTMFVSRYSNLGSRSDLSCGLINAGKGTEPNGRYTIDPEYREYYPYRPKQQIEVERGFSSAQFIAEDLTQKLQEITTNDTLVFAGTYLDQYSPAYPALGNPINVTRIVESNCYKTLNCMTAGLCSADAYNNIAGDSIPLVNTWYNNFQAVGMKRPELYIKGQAINMIAEPNILNTSFSTITPDRLLGSETRATFSFGADEPLRTLIPYTKDNLKILKDFIDTQDLYPEIWENWNGTTAGSAKGQISYGDGTHYNSKHTIDNTRFFHINKTSAANKVEVTTYEIKTTAQLDYDATTLTIRIPFAGILYQQSNTITNVTISDGSDPSTFTDLQVLKATLVTQPFYAQQTQDLKVVLPGGVSITSGQALTIKAVSVIGSIANNTMAGNYSIGATSINVHYDGTSTGLMGPDLMYDSVEFRGNSESQQYVEVTNAVDLGNGVQTLTLASPGLTSAVSVDDAVSFNVTTAYQSARRQLTHTTLGSSLYRGSTQITTSSASSGLLESALFLVYYQESDKDTYYDNPSYDAGKFTYGCFTKESYSLNGITGDFINIHPQVSAGSVSDVTFSLSMPPEFSQNPPSTNIPIESGRKWGYDLHATAIGQPQIALYNGDGVGANYYGQAFTNRYTLPKVGENSNEGENLSFTDPDGTYYSTYGYLNRRYIGADSPKVNWDGEHFNISDLHTGENLRSRGADGGRICNDINPTGPSGTDGENTAFAYIVSDVPTAQGDPIYTMNPFQNMDEFCPQLMPYQKQLELFTRNGNSTKTGAAGKQLFNQFNYNYEPFEIYDSKSGVFLEDMGYDEETWDKSLWGVMGFSYAQFNGSQNNRGKRVDNTNITSLMIPTTNANIQATDTKNYTTNENGIVHFTDNLPAPFMLYNYNLNGQITVDSGTTQNVWPINPNINVKTSSILLTAENFPTSMIKGYYTIRSDIIPQSIFVGGSNNITNMPIIGMVNKENPQSDYYFGGESDVQFTIGRPTSLSSIKVGIFDPDGTPANVGESSSVIFKVERQIKTSFNIIGDILANGKKGKAKI